jgi:hypothetical protein
MKTTYVSLGCNDFELRLKEVAIAILLPERKMVGFAELANG